MKIVYMGTPDFAVTILDRLIAAGHEIDLVFTQPDRPRAAAKNCRHHRWPNMRKNTG